MSTHPNAILMAILTPEDLSRKTMKAILAEDGRDVDDDYQRDMEIKVGEDKYNHLCMEDSYDESFQISAQEGDLIFFDMVTYGYGETIEWNSLEKKKVNLEKWAIETCQKHHCSYKIYVSANYW